MSEARKRATVAVSVPLIIQLIAAAAILFAPRGFDHRPAGGLDFGGILVLSFIYMLSLGAGLIICYVHSSIGWAAVQILGLAIIASAIFYDASGAGLPRKTQLREEPGTSISD